MSPSTKNDNLLLSKRAIDWQPHTCFCSSGLPLTIESMLSISSSVCRKSLSPAAGAAAALSACAAPPLLAAAPAAVGPASVKNEELGAAGAASVAASAAGIALAPLAPRLAATPPAAPSSRSWGGMLARFFSSNLELLDAVVLIVDAGCPAAGDDGKPPPGCFCCCCTYEVWLQHSGVRLMPKHDGVKCLGSDDPLKCNAPASKHPCKNKKRILISKQD